MIDEWLYWWKKCYPSLSDGLNWNNRNENWIEEIEDD